jgi:hypothetical protein
MIRLYLIIPMYVCYNCTRKFKTFNMFSEHNCPKSYLRRGCGKLKRVQHVCKCGVVYSNKANLINHQETKCSLNPVPIKHMCDCGRLFESKHYLDIHYKRACPSNPYTRPYECDTCQKVFIAPTSFYSHKKTCKQ